MSVCVCVCVCVCLCVQGVGGGEDIPNRDLGSKLMYLNMSLYCVHCKQTKEVHKLV